MVLKVDWQLLMWTETANLDMNLELSPSRIKVLKSGMLGPGVTCFVGKHSGLLLTAISAWTSWEHRQKTYLIGFPCFGRE
jgi:hypothetical protein